MSKKTFGACFKRLRIASGQTLRAFCTTHGFDAGNMSKLERGLLAPPASNEKLEEYATALGLAHGSDAWIDFFDRAAAARGRVPQDILSDEQLAKRLPAVFRTLRGAKASKSDLLKLVEKIRRA
jgi:transcriptional regulator with XRE-family HTH domain